MHTPFYRHVFRDAWHGSWRNKRLWILGLLSAFWGVTGLQMVWDWSDAVFRQNGTLEYYRDHVSRFTPPVGPVGFSSIATFISLVALMALLLWVVTASRAGIYWALHKTGVNHAGQGITSEALRVGTKHFWPTLIVNALGRLAIGILFCILLYAVRFIGTANVWTLAVSMVVIIAVTLGALGVGMMTVFATLGLVTGSTTIVGAVRTAARHVHRHRLVILESVVLLYMANMVAWFGMLLIGAALVFPVLMMLVVTSIISSAASLWLVAVPLGVIMLVALMIVGAWYATFEAAAWTSLYRRTQETSPVPKIYRLAASLKARFKK